MRDETSMGYREFGGNEETLASTIPDPPKQRFAAPSGSFGCLSGNVLRPDGGQNEKVLLIFKPDEDAGGDGGCYEFFAQRPGTDDDANMIRLLTLNTREAVFHVPIRMANGAPPPAPPQPPPPAPQPAPSPSDPTHGIPEGDFAAIVRYYTFGSDDEAPYREGRMSWLDVIQRMDQRAR